MSRHSNLVERRKDIANALKNQEDVEKRLNVIGPVIGASVRFETEKGWTDSIKVSANALGKISAILAEEKEALEKEKEALDLRLNAVETLLRGFE